MAHINHFVNEQGAHFIDNSESIITISPEGTKVYQKEGQTAHPADTEYQTVHPTDAEYQTATGGSSVQDSFSAYSFTPEEGKEAAQQLTNRQIVIMMTGLLDLSLSPEYTNQKQLAQFLSRLTGRSENSIRQTIMNLAKTGIETPQARKDSLIAADVLAPMCPRVASRLRNDAEE